MGKRYQIWDRQSEVITPIGEVLSPQEWMARYPASAKIDYVIAAGTINGAFCTPLATMISTYEQMGADFSDCIDPNDYIDVIESFDDAKVKAMQSMQNMPSDQERIAAALEFLAMNSLPDTSV